MYILLDWLTVSAHLSYLFFAVSKWRRKTSNLMVVLDRDEKLLWSGLQWVTATKWRHCLFYFQQYFSALETVLQKIVHGSFSSNSRLIADGSWSLSGNCKSVIEIFWDEVFMVRNTLKIGQSWCLAVICKKRSAFDMQFHLVIVSIFLKTRVKDRGDTSSRLLERKI